MVPGYASPLGGRNATNHIYFTPSLDAARRGAELSVGEGLGRIYRVEPTGPFEHDPNLSDFPGNPALSYARGNLSACLAKSGVGGSTPPRCGSSILHSTTKLTPLLGPGPTPTMTVRGSGRTMAEAFAGLTGDQKSRYLNPPYTIGSAMIWPLRTKDQPTMNTARGFGSEGQQIGDRMDLTLECIRRHYAGEPESPLADVTNVDKDFFELFRDFKGFVEFFHFQDLLTPDDNVQFYLPFEGFEPFGTPATTEEYVTYREATLVFICRRTRRMAKWVREHHPDIEVRE